MTGTPLQNSLLELWSLMHFLMPDVFASHSEFREWFAEVGAMAEGARYDEALVRRLHAVLRPFLLRRLKRDVERQMPRKYEHVLLCRLAKRQRFLYDDFMSRAKSVPAAPLATARDAPCTITVRVVPAGRKKVSLRETC